MDGSIILNVEIKKFWDHNRKEYSQKYLQFTDPEKINSDFPDMKERRTLLSQVEIFLSRWNSQLWESRQMIASRQIFAEVASASKLWKWRARGRKRAALYRQGEDSKFPVTTEYASF